MKESKKISFVDDEFGDDFISSWKPALDFEDDERTPGNCKTSFSLHKMDMDFEFDGGLKALSSFNVDISELDAFPSRSSKTGDKSHHNPKACDSVGKGNAKFCFEFDGFDDFDLETTLKTNKEPTSQTTLKEEESEGELVLDEPPRQKTEERNQIMVDHSIFDNSSTKEIPTRNPSRGRRTVAPTSGEASIDERSVRIHSRERTMFDVSKENREQNRYIPVDESDGVKIFGSDEVIDEETKRKSDEQDTQSTKESPKVFPKHIKVLPTASSNSEHSEPNTEIAEKLDVSSQEAEWLPEKVPEKSLQEDARIESPKMSFQLGSDMKSRKSLSRCDLEMPDATRDIYLIQQNDDTENAHNEEKLPGDTPLARQSCASRNLPGQGGNKQTSDSATTIEPEVIPPEMRSIQSKDNVIVEPSDPNKSLQCGQASSKTSSPRSPRFVTGINHQRLQRSRENKGSLSMDDSVNSKNLAEPPQKSGSPSVTHQANKRNLQQVFDVKSSTNSHKNITAKRPKTIDESEGLGGHKSGFVHQGKTKSPEPTRAASRKAFKIEDDSQGKTEEDNTMEPLAISNPDESAPQNDVKDMETVEDSSKLPGLQVTECTDKIKQNAENYTNRLDNFLKMLKQKHEEAMDLRVRALVINNTYLVLNNPVDDEKIRKITRYIHEKLFTANQKASKVS